MYTKNYGRTIFTISIAAYLVLDHVSPIKATSEVSNYEFWPSNILGKRAMQLVRDHLSRRQERKKSRTSKQICYDMVGCFPIPRTSYSPLMKSPQSPDTVDTKFLVMNRQNRNDLILVTYGDRHVSMNNSNFKPKLPTKIIIHGFKGSGHNKVARLLGNALLDLEDVNVIFVDWEKGAAGPGYALAAANTQLIGRQLALLITDMVALNGDPAKIHMIGFSLGAHVAGFAGKALKLIDIRVGLDSASPLFRQMLSASLLSLSSDDASFVDVVHTDGARIWSEGFGLFNPIGDVDYFPNGSLHQPGCEQIRGSVIVSRFEGTMNSSVVCNHLRALQFFLESLKAASDPDACQFTTFPCPARWSMFQRGECFPTNCTDSNCVTMGFAASQSKLRGPLYLTTIEIQVHFVGRQLKASVLLSPKTSKLRGYLQISLEDGDNTANFKLRTNVLFISKLNSYLSWHTDYISGGLLAEGLSVARYEKSVQKYLNVELSFQSLAYQTENEKHGLNSNINVVVDKVSIFDTEGNVWSNCTENSNLMHVDGTTIYAQTYTLSLFDAC